MHQNTKSRLSGALGRLGESVAVARMRRGVTQAGLAAKSGVSERTIRDLEQGRVRRPRRQTLMLISRALEVEDAEHARWEGLRMSRMPGGGSLAPPGPATTLTGREAVIDLLAGAINAREQRWLSLVGIAGVGKTAVAVEVAARVDDPVLWIGADDEVGPDEIAALVGADSTLVVLDDPAPRWSAKRELDRLLIQCPRLRLLITSRVRYGPRGAHVAPLLPLGIDDALHLFASRLRLRRLDEPLIGGAVAAVEEICRALDGIPAAVVSAAEWFGIYPVDRLVQIARHDPFRLTDHRPDTDFSSAIAHTIDSLSPLESGVLAMTAGHEHLSLEMVRNCCGLSEPAAAAALRGLAVLGLLTQTDDGEFRALNLVRSLSRAHSHSA
ncbi:helix-turn-helix transcriptional regulator [Amycolatopsis lurida]